MIKKDLRKKIRLLRDSMSREENLRLSARIAANLFNTKEYIEVRCRTEQLVPSNENERCSAESPENRIIPCMLTEIRDGYVLGCPAMEEEQNGN